MKKVFLAVIFVFLLTLFPKISYAADCVSLGGTCRNSCNLDEKGGLGSCPTSIKAGNLNCCVPNPNSPICDGGLGVNTAIGCLKAADPAGFISQLLSWGASIGGGISFVMIVLAGLQMTTAAGDPKKVQAARELLTSAITGLILIVLSVVILNLIGVSVLGLGGLGFKVGL